MVINTHSIPKALLARYPQLAQIGAAIEQYQSGKALSVSCPQCHSVLKVTENRQAGSLTVSCSCGHCQHRISWQPS
ncbi:hypothetical protein [Oceanospirillum sediminis]|uniref:Uncharacterized protein n=1 Tax=Oceanospirillum sediminis TaxID=2760088 RepID=A0A839IRG2_9GAMM|nr:hypothetical protein [Oceanospirillum sediminis]MBB1487132.1 hypothetical protein [Oceanospirillum sediminis]